MSVVGDLLGGGSQAAAAGAQAAEAQNALNFDQSVYNTTQGQVAPYVSSGTAANSAESQLLGLSPMTAQTQTGMNNYLNSTGYNFNLQQGQQAVTGSAASRGILNSGSTAKALTQYGQNLGSSYFNNYLSSLGGVAGQGLQATGIGATAGSNAANSVNNATNTMANSTANLGGALASGTSGSNLLTSALGSVAAFL